MRAPVVATEPADRSRIDEAAAQGGATVARSWWGRAWRRARRGLRVGVLVLLGAYALYLLAANVLLGTGLLRHFLNTHADKLKVEYASAWSFYPGHVRAKSLSVRNQSRDVQLLVDLDRATLTVDLLALPRRTFRVRSAHVEGASFRLRQRLEHLAGQEGRVRAFPPIDGFEDPPLRPKKEPRAVEDDDKRWTIELHDVTGSLRELWTMEYRYRGEASLTGAMRLKPKREVSISPSVLLLHHGVVSLGNGELLHDLDGRLDVQLETFDVRASRPIEILRHLSVHAQQRGKVVSIAPLGTTYLAGSAYTLAGGHGSFAIDVRVDHGVLEPESRVTFRSGEVTVRTPPVTFRSDVAIVGRIEASARRRSLVTDATMARVGVSPSSGPSGHALDVREAHVSLDVGTADLAAPFELTRLAIDTPSAEIADLREWQPLAPKPMKLEGGRATIAARATFRKGGAVDGTAQVWLDRTRGSVGPFAWACSGQAWTTLAADDARRSIAIPSAGFDLTGLNLRFSRATADSLWMRARLDETNVTPFGLADAGIRVESGPGDRTVRFFTRLASLPDIAADFASGSRLDARLHLRVRPDDVALTIDKAVNGRLEGTGRIRHRGESTTGAFFLTVGLLRAGVALKDGEVNVVPFASANWLAETLAAFDRP